MWTNKNKQNKRRKNKNMRRNGMNGGAAYQLARLKTYSNFESSSIGFLDPHKYITMKYTDVLSLSLAAITGTNQIYRLNSIFDPDLTGTGHQPYGYDQISALYNRYRVLAAEWVITFHAEALGFYAVVVPTNGNLATAITNVASFTAAGETPRSVTKAQGTGANAVVFRGKIDLNNLNGVTLTEYLADDRFEAQIGANPAELIILNIGNYNPATGSAVIIDFSVEIYYHVDLHDPIVQAQS